MDIIVIGSVALLASLLTFFSGFGLGTLLLPAFALFFSVEIAVALTGIVHLLNNIFKITLVFKHIRWRIAVKFGVPAIVGALIGALILIYFSENNASYFYAIGQKEYTITPVKVVIAVLMFGFALQELLPIFKKLSFSENNLSIGGLMSGFFGGLSGHQGALRSVFLIKCGLTKESFIATGVIIASVVDIARISIYFTQYYRFDIKENVVVLLSAIGCAFLGAILGKKLVKKVTIHFVHFTVSILVMILAFLVGLGLI